MVCSWAITNHFVTEDDCCHEMVHDSPAMLC